ncbi:arsenite efflux transporter metallochaperone ArsD [Shouchella shacheensis]|uniref:arsenite efflux transporter metallochaperone ArsD n=1 Tax=Shouchella shacheensis TaxID=1649580 RepID=UPI00073FB8B2|nr:arsenite efflux transporter metallochaperone ArsD [Shouchella shacheensis]
MQKIEIYDPAMCCDTGVCGPVVDPNLTELATVIHTLNKKGLTVHRFNLANDPQAFADNKVVNQVLHEKGTDALPLVLVDNEVYKTGEYPTVEEFSSWYGVSSEELAVKKPKKPLNINLEVKGEK